MASQPRNGSYEASFLRERRFFFLGVEMDIYRVGFIGHRVVYHFRPIEAQLRQIILKLLEEKEFVEFYIGRNGDFDILVASIIKGIQRDVGTHNNCLILVLPYPVADYKYYEEYYDEILIPHNLNHVHFKAAIGKRNDWIIENTDLLIMHVVREEGNSAKCKKKAEKIGREIINLV